MNCDTALDLSANPEDKVPGEVYQPSSEVESDAYGNAYLDFNGDFVNRDKDNEVVSTC